MMKVKKAVTLILVMGLMVSCSVSGVTPQDKYLADWKMNANLYAEETAEELYAKALEEDTLIVYSITTRMFDVADSFMEEYPGLTVEIYDNRAPDLIDFIENSYENNDFACDIIVSTDETGVYVEEFIPRNIVNTYIPSDIEPFIIDYYEDGLLPFVGEFQQLFYNNETYDQCPVDNWWELTEEKWRDSIYMNTPLRSQSSIAFLHGMLNHSEDIADAYYDRYGEELVVPDGSTAAEIFIEKLVNNGMKYTNSSNEIVEIVGAPNQENPPLAFMISSKVRYQKLGYNIEAAYGINPSDGVFSPNCIGIVGGARNVSSAKLFIRWVMGESDGTGVGKDPYYLEGTWPVRTDLVSQSAVSLEEGNFWYNNKSDIIAQNDEIMEFWRNLHGSTT